MTDFLDVRLTPDTTLRVYLNDACIRASIKAAYECGLMDSKAKEIQNVRKV